ncbi:hypothetical protein [Cupriavidus basilensis]
MKQVMPATGGLTVNSGSWQVRGQSSRYRQMPAGTPGRTTKSSTFESLIALPPAGSAFFSLVFFAEAKKSDRRPPQGDVVFFWVQKPTSQKKQRSPPTTTTTLQPLNNSLLHATDGASREDAVLVISSGGAIGRATADLLGAPAQTAIELNLQFRNTAFCEIISGRGMLRLLSFNDLPHLDRVDRRDAITFA